MSSHVPNQFMITRHLRDNSFISHQHQLLYVATPKVACTTLKWWFARLVGIQAVNTFEGDSVESAPDLVIHDVLRPFAPAIGHQHERGLSAALESLDYFRF